MIAKLITHGGDRAAAFSALHQGLCQTHIMGTVTNTSFLAVLVSHQDVADMAIDTTWIDRHLDELNANMLADDDDLTLMTLAHLSADGGIAEGQGWRIWGQATRLVRVRAGDQVIERRVHYLSDRDVMVSGGHQDQNVQLIDSGDSQLTVKRQTAQGTTRTSILRWIDHLGQISIDLGHGHHRIMRIDPLDVVGDQSSGHTITAPMTGVITVVEYEEGQKVAAGDILVRMEAMKMEHALTAPCNGTIANVYIAVRRP